MTSEQTPPLPFAIRQQSSEAAGPSGPARVLVVDDQEYVGIIALRWFRRAADVEFAGWLPTPDRLESRLQELTADAGPVILVIDWNIPGHAVDELLPDLRARFPALGIIVFTGDVECESRARAIGADLCLCKDIGPEVLLRAIESLAGQIRRRQG